MNTYTAGQIVITNGTFYDDNNNPMDPGAVTVEYTCSNLAGETTLTYTGSSTAGTGYIFKTAVGAYQLRIDTTPLVGYLKWQWNGAGVGQTNNASSAIIHPDPIAGISPAMTSTSFLRAFGPDTSSTIPANTWTAIVLDPAGEPWRQFGPATWEWIPPGDPDQAISTAGIRCLTEGVYDFAGSVVFNPAQGTGTRGVRVIEVKGPYAGQWQLTMSIPMPKSSLAPVLVAGESYQYVGNIVELQAWSDTVTSTNSNPESEWLSATLIEDT